MREIPQDQDELSFGNEVYRVQFDERELTPRYGHRYSFFLKDAVDEVPEYVVHWDEFVQYVPTLPLEGIPDEGVDWQPSMDSSSSIARTFIMSFWTRDGTQSLQISSLA